MVSVLIINNIVGNLLIALRSCKIIYNFKILYDASEAKTLLK